MGLSMSKYDRMLEINRKTSKEKISRARAVIREMLQEQQTGILDPRRQIMDLAMNKQIDELKKQNYRLKSENEKLKEENAKLLKALGKKNLSIVKNL